jgi:hypothetical protein
MRNTIEVKRVDLWSLFKVAFCAYGFLGVIGGLFYLGFMLLLTGFGSTFLEEEFPKFGLLGGVVGIIIVPAFAFLYAAIGGMFAVIMGAIVNLIMKATGGVKFDVDMPLVRGAYEAAASGATGAAPFGDAGVVADAGAQTPPPYEPTPPEGSGGFGEGT